MALVVKKKKKTTCQCRRGKRHWFHPWIRKVPWRKASQPTPVFLPGESHGQRSLVGHSPCNAWSLQSCLTFCDPMDCSLPVSSVHEILQARILEWVAISAPGDLSDSGAEPASPALQADSLPLSHWGSPSYHP